MIATAASLLLLLVITAVALVLARIAWVKVVHPTGLLSVHVAFGLVLAAAEYGIYRLALALLT